MIDLKKVDLIIIDCVEPEQAVETLDICTTDINFGNTIIFTDNNIKCNNHKLIKINKLKTIHEYSDFCLSLNKYLNNDFVLIFQNDGYILNPHLWDDSFLEYDYIGSPWMQTPLVEQKVGNGGFSLRSKKFLEFSSQYTTTNEIPEDNFLCIDKYYEAMEYGINYADSYIGNQFSYEYKNIYCETFDPSKHFGFHGKHNLVESNNYIKNIRQTS